VFFPIYLEKNILQIVLLSDTIFLSLISSDAVAGVGAAVPIIYTLVAMIGTLGTATMGLMGQYLGAKREADVLDIFVLALTIGVAIGIVLCIFQVLLSYYAPGLIGISVQATEASADYLFFLAPMLVTDGVFIVVASVINVHGKARWTLFASVALAATNIGLNFLIYQGAFPGIVLEPKTVALSTLASQIPALLIMAYCVSRILKLELSRFYWNWSRLRRLSKDVSDILLPSLVNPLTANFTQFMMAIYLSRFGTDVFAAFVYCRNILIPVTTATTLAFSNTTQIFVARLQGETKFYEAKQFLNRNLACFLPYVLIAVTAIWYGFPTLFELIGSDPALTVHAAVILFFLIFIETFRSAWRILDPSLRGSGYARVPVLFFVTSQLGIVLLGYVLVVRTGMPLEFLLTAIAVGEGLFALLLFLQWNSSAWIEPAKARLCRDKKATASPACN